MRAPRKQSWAATFESFIVLQEKIGVPSLFCECFWVIGGDQLHFFFSFWLPELENSFFA